MCTQALGVPTGNSYPNKTKYKLFVGKNNVRMDILDVLSLRKRYTFQKISGYGAGYTALPSESRTNQSSGVCACNIFRFAHSSVYDVRGRQTLRTVK